MRQIGCLLCLLLLTACGQAGDLYLPDQSPPANQSGPESAGPPAAKADADSDADAKADADSDAIQGKTLPPQKDAR